MKIVPYLTHLRNSVLRPRWKGLPLALILLSCCLIGWIVVSDPVRDIRGLFARSNGISGSVDDQKERMSSDRSRHEDLLQKRPGLASREPELIDSSTASSSALLSALQEKLRDPAISFSSLWEEFLTLPADTPGRDAFLVALFSRALSAGEGKAVLSAIQAKDFSSRELAHFTKLFFGSEQHNFDELISLAGEPEIFSSERVRDIAVETLVARLQDDPFKHLSAYESLIAIAGSKSSLRIGDHLGRHLSNNGFVMLRFDESLKRLNEFLGKLGDSTTKDMVRQAALDRLAATDATGAMAAAESGAEADFAIASLQQAASNIMAVGYYHKIAEEFDKWGQVMPSHELFDEWSKLDEGGLRKWLNQPNSEIPQELAEQASASLMLKDVGGDLEQVQAARENLSEYTTDAVRQQAQTRLDQLEEEIVHQQYQDSPQEVVDLALSGDSALALSTISSIIQEHLQVDSENARAVLHERWPRLHHDVQQTIARDAAARSLREGNTAQAKEWMSLVEAD